MCSNRITGLPAALLNENRAAGSLYRPGHDRPIAARERKDRMRQAYLPMAVVMVMCLGVTDCALALNSYWQVGTGNWSIDSNWRNGEPGRYDHAYVSNGGTATVDQPEETFNRLYLGYLNGERGTVEITAGDLSGGGYQYIGYDGVGTVNQSGGTYTSGPLYLGYQSGSEGTYNLSQTGHLSAGYEYIGYSGTGTFSQSGGRNSLSGYYDDLYLGHNTGSSGTYELSGTGELSAGTEYVGYRCTGAFAQSGGTNTVSGSIYVGYEGTGAFDQSGGTNTVSGSL